MIKKLSELQPLKIYQSDAVENQYYAYLGQKNIICSKIPHDSHDMYKRSGHIFIELTAREVRLAKKYEVPIEMVIRNHVYGGKIAFLSVCRENKYNVPLDIHLDTEHKGCTLWNKEIAIAPREEDNGNYIVLIEDIQDAS